MNILLWHVHGSWTTAFVQGRHTYILPTLADRGPFGRGRADTWEWPASVIERSPDDLATTPIDVVVVQRPEEELLAARWSGRRPGRDVPAVWLEHNTPQGRIADMIHPAADRDDLTVVHVTHTNQLFWDTGTTPTRVIEHGIIDPGHRYRGELARAAVAINDPLRRNRVTGTDLLPGLAAHVPVDLFGIGAGAAARRLADAGHDVTGYDDVPQHRLHDALARRRVYAHTCRWTSLGLSLLEAMAIGVPVVALATTEAPDAIRAGAGIVTNRIDRFHDSVRQLCADPDRAAALGAAGRAAVLERYSLASFLRRWDELLAEVAGRSGIHDAPTPSGES